MESQKKTLSAGVKKAVAIALMGAVCLTAAVSVGSLSKKVTVTDGNETVTSDTCNPETEAILSKTGKELGENDKLVRTDDGKNGVDLSIIRAIDVDTPDTDKKTVFNETSVADSLLSAGMTLSNNESRSLAAALETSGPEAEVKLARYEITADVRGEKITKYVPAGTVKNALDYLEIIIGENDQINVDINKNVQEGMLIEIKHIEVKEVKAVSSIDYQTTYQNSDSLYEGETTVAVSGIEGERTITTKETYVNGVLESKEVVKNEVTKEPVNEIILNGTKEKPAPVVETPVYQNYTNYTDGYIYPYLTPTMGRNLNGPSGQETYYNMDMSGIVSSLQRGGWMYNQCVNQDLIDHILDTSGYWIREDGCKMFGDYIMVAAGLDVRPRGSLVQTSLGMGIVVDTGGFAYNDPWQLDIATAW